MGNPEQDARGEIDQLLVQAGWHVCDADQANITAYRGVAIREFPLPGHGFADYLLYSVGYRVKSHRGTQFRIWATQQLREYIIKGFALDDERLKRGGGGNYFDAYLIDLTATSSKQTFGFFHQNLVMEYNHDWKSRSSQNPIARALL